MAASSKPPAGSDRWSAVVGSPIDHSLSPTLHQAAYEGLGLTGWSYGTREVRAGELRDVVASLDGACAGLSVTMPGKREAAELADTRCEWTQLLGVANTLVPGDGWHAHNTDVEGIRRALDSRVDGDTALVVGGGATAASALAALAALGVSRVTVALRTPPKAAPLRPIAAELGIRLSIAALDGDIDPVGVAVSCVPHGVAGGIIDDPANRRLRAALLATSTAVLDVAYAPWPSALARGRAESGGLTVSGLDMLVYQAVEQVVLMTGMRPHPEWLFSALGVTH